MEERPKKLKPLPEGFIQKFITHCIKKAYSNAIISTVKGTNQKTARIIGKSGDHVEEISRKIDLYILKDFNNFIRAELGDPKDYERKALNFESVIQGKTLEIRY